MPYHPGSRCLLPVFFLGIRATLAFPFIGYIHANLVLRCALSAKILSDTDHGDTALQQGCSLSPSIAGFSGARVCFTPQSRCPEIQLRINAVCTLQRRNRVGRPQLLQFSIESNHWQGPDRPPEGVPLHG